MKKIHIIIIAILVLFIAVVADVVNFKNNGGHSGNSIVENSEEIAQNIAEMWAENSASTYVFDGEGLLFIESTKGDCERCFIFTFSFDSRHGGYGNREGLFVIQVITPHIIKIEIKDDKVISAIIDEKYNELTGAIAE